MRARRSSARARVSVCVLATVWWTVWWAASLGARGVQGVEGSILTVSDLREPESDADPSLDVYSTAYYGRVQACAAGRTTDPGASSEADCSCDAGYFSSGSGCEPCAAGSYKADHVQAGCTACGAHATSLPGATSATECLCNAGHEPAGDGACRECAQGSFKSSVGNSSCLACPTGATTAAEGTASYTACLCPAGFAGEAHVCEECPVNTYADELGMSTCTQCPDITQAARGSTEATACVCPAGFYGLGAACEACAHGTYKSEAGTNIPAVSADNPCEACPAHTDTASDGSTARTDCLCSAGYYNAGYAAENGCAACAPGHFKAGLGPEACELCSDNTYTGQSAAASCLACPTNAEALPDKTVCQCAAGYSESVDAGGTRGCWPCQLETYKTGAGNASSLCTPCPANAYAPAGSTSSDSCECKPGYSGLNGAECVGCAMGTYNLEFGATECTLCAVGKYLNQTLSTADNCVDCPASSYQDQEGQAMCLQCPDHATSPPASEAFGACRCEDGRHMFSQACEQCPEKYYCTDNQKYSCNDNAFSPAGSASTGSCVCNPGFYASASVQEGMPTCVQCEANHYCVNEMSREACPDHSVSPSGSTSVDACVCDPGYREL